MLLLLLFVHCSALCSIRHAFTDCIESEKTAIFYSETQDCPSIPDTVPNLSCDFPCPPGHHYDIDDSFSPTCSPCPNNTYSIGGGIAFNGAKSGWLNFTNSFITKCIGENRNCGTWESPTGHSIRTGKQAIGEWSEASLHGYFHIKKAGELRVRYRKDTVYLADNRNGVFTIKINGKLKVEDSDVEPFRWEERIIDIEPGLVNILFFYQHIETGGNMIAEISDLEIRGTEFAASECLPCTSGLSDPGSDSCSLCPVNTFYNHSECSPCPQNTHSHVNSISLDDCKPNPLCKTSDFTYKFSNCIEGSRNKKFYWKEPMICQGGEPLPGDVMRIECETCQPGYYQKTVIEAETECGPCPIGTYQPELNSQSKCMNCPVGTVGNPKINYTVWDELPSNMKTECILYSGTNCNHSYGWELAGEYISSGRNLDEFSWLSLVLKTQIIRENAFIQFKYSIENKMDYETRLNIHIDGILYSSYAAATTMEITEPIYLTRGNKTITFAYDHHSHNRTNILDLCKIHWIYIAGSSEGGADHCAPCHEGEVSLKDSWMCGTCPAGTQPNSERNDCEVCSHGTHSQDGLNCEICPVNTTPDLSNEYCVSTEFLEIGKEKYYISYLSGRKNTTSLYCSEDKMLKYCEGSLYGPVSSNLNFFYTSVLNPYSLSIESYLQIDSLDTGYAFGVIDSTELDVPIPQSHSKCPEHRSKGIINLGTIISNITQEDNGFTIEYSGGSSCSDQNADSHSTQVKFTCDKDRHEGYPQFITEEHCKVKFEWRSKWGCPLCVNYTTVTSRCENGLRTIREIEYENCVIVNPLRTETCSESYEAIDTTVMIVILSTVFLLLVGSFTVLACFCKFKRKYLQLVEVQVSESVAESNP